MTSVTEFIRGMPKAELHIHIEGVLGTVRYLLGEFDLKEPFRAFVDGLEWLNGTMRLNRAFWMAIDNIREWS